MSKTTNKTTAAKVAAKVATTTTAAELSAEAVARIAADVAAGCATCKAVAAKFNGLVCKYGKEDAAKIQAAAKSIVTTAKATTKDGAKDAKAFLNCGADIARAAWADLLNQDRAGAQFARMVFDHCGRSLAVVVTRFASYTTTKDGKAVAVVKYTTKDKDGNRRDEYRPRNLATVGGYLAALKVSINNAKRAALGEPSAKWQTIIDADQVRF